MHLLSSDLVWWVDFNGSAVREGNTWKDDFENWKERQRGSVFGVQFFKSLDFSFAKCHLFGLK